MGKKVTATAVSKRASTSAPAAVSSSSSSNKSSILRSSFAPSYLQLHLFASVIQSFDSQQLRIHDTNSGRLRQLHSASPGTTITSLDWGHYGASSRQNGQNSNKKKRKRAQASEDVVIAYGTSTSDVLMYSHTEGRVVGTLTGAHEGGVQDFRFSLENDSEAWSIGGDGKLVQWDLSQDQAIRSIPLPDSTIRILSLPLSQGAQILCASNTPYSISPSEDFRIDRFDSFRGQVHSLKRSGRSNTGTSELFLAVDHDRYVNVFDIDQQKLVRTLVAGSEVEQIDLLSSDVPSQKVEEQILVAVTRDGLAELFFQPFKTPSAVNGDIKSKRKNMTRKADAQVKLVGSGKESLILAASLRGPDVIVVSVEGGVEPTFQKVRWQDEGSGELLFSGLKEVSRIKSTSTISAVQMNGVKNMGKTHIDESNTVVVNGTGELAPQDITIELSSGEDEADEDEDEDEDGADGEHSLEDGSTALNNGKATEEDEEEEQEEEEEGEGEEEKSSALTIKKRSSAPEDTEMEDAEDEEPTFGDLLASKHPNTIAIADSFAPEKSTFDASKQLALPSGMSLGTVLTQALRTNDTNLLESCLHANDAGIIQNTIQRLDSTLASILLSKLAERLASRPGRYGHLLSWVQWTCIAHGGAIAGQPAVAARIRSLYRVLTQRSKSLDKLLLLKGKLDMLDAQLTLRKQIQAQRGAQLHDQGEPGMIYIEGEEDNWSSDEDIDEAVGSSKKLKSKTKNRRDLADLVGSEATSEDDDDDDMPLVNGTAAEDSEEEKSDEEAETTGRANGSMYDIEADVSGEDESDEEGEGDEIDGSDDDEDDDEEDSSMDSFINDGEISIASDEDGIDLDDEPQIRKPEKKRSKHR